MNPIQKSSQASKRSVNREMPFENVVRNKTLKRTKQLLQKAAKKATQVNPLLDLEPLILKNATIISEETIIDETTRSETTSRETTSRETTSHGTTSRETTSHGTRTREMTSDETKNVGMTNKAKTAVTEGTMTDEIIMIGATMIGMETTAVETTEEVEEMIERTAI
jgi:hypothetical protein